MNNPYVGLLGGGEAQVSMANRLAEEPGRRVIAMFLRSPALSPAVEVPEDFRDGLWRCGVLILPDPVCRRGLELNAPFWPGTVDAGQFLDRIGKGVLLLAGETTPEFRAAAAAREVALTPFPIP